MKWWGGEERERRGMSSRWSPSGKIKTGIKDKISKLQIKITNKL